MPLNLEDKLEPFTRAFLARVPVTRLSWQIISNLLDEHSQLNTSTEDHLLNCQNEILKATISHSMCQKYPPPSNYVRQFLKTLISKIEHLNCEVSSDLLQIYGMLISQNHNEEAGYRTFKLFLDSYISLKENVSIISSGTTGLCTWQAGFYLAEWCLNNKCRLQSRNIIELGSGAGLVGLTCFKHCEPKSVTLTDYHPKVMETLRFNVNINGSSNEPNVEPLDWIEFSESNGDENGNLRGDVVLASDVVYDSDLIPYLVRTLAILLNRSDSVRPFAIFACTERNEATLNEFLSALSAHHLEYQMLDHAPAVFHCERTYPVRIYEIHSETIASGKRD